MWAINRVSVLLHMEAGNHVHIGRCRVRVKNLLSRYVFLKLLKARSSFYVYNHRDIYVVCVDVSPLSS